MLRPFRLHQPASIEEAVSLLARYGDAARAYAGGTELLLAMKAGLLRPQHLVNLKTIPGMDGVLYDPAAGELSIGPTATHWALERSPALLEHFALLADVEHRVGNVRVRSMGTLGGNLCFAEPHSDPGVALLLYEAQVETTGPGGPRRFPLEGLAVGPYETCLGQTELLTRVLVPRLPPGMKAACLKFGYHERPTLGMGVAVEMDAHGRIAEVRIAMGSVGPRPLRVRQAEELLRGAELEEALRGGPRSGASALERASQAAVQAVQPVSDLHGSAEYKAHLVGVFLRQALQRALVT